MTLLHESKRPTDDAPAADADLWAAFHDSIAEVGTTGVLNSAQPLERSLALLPALPAQP